MEGVFCFEDFEIGGQREEADEKQDDLAAFDGIDHLAQIGDFWRIGQRIVRRQGLRSGDQLEHVQQGEERECEIEMQGKELVPRHRFEETQHCVR